MSTEMPKKILVIDDNRDIREYVRFVLESNGYAVDESEDGDHAIRQCAKQEYAVIISDILMPGLDGIETIKALKARYVDILFIAMSGLDTYNSLFETNDIFLADVVLTKPFSQKDLLHAVEKAWAHCQIQ